MPFQPFEEEDPFTAEDWLEAVSQLAPQDTFANDNSESVIPVYIKDATASRLRSAMTYVLGYSHADDGDPYQLHRVTGPGHPVWGYQYRPVAVNFTRFNPVANPDNEDNKPFKLSAITSPDGPIEKYATYGQCWMTVRFAPRPFYLYKDDSPEWSGKEYDRFVEINRESSLDVLMSDAGTNAVLFWAETGTGGPTVGGDPPSAFPGQIGELVYKTNVTMLWREVAMSYTHNANGVPTKVDACVGKVNDAEFMGYPAGTLLMYPPKWEKKLFPFYSEDGRAFYHNVLLTFGHFDPEPGAASPLARGHQLMPWRGGDSGATIGGPGWYTCYRGNSTSGKKYLKEADFETIFEHIDL